jgi:hypothetical protein
MSHIEDELYAGHASFQAHNHHHPHAVMMTNAGPLYTTLEQMPSADLVAQLVNVLAQVPQVLSQQAMPLVREIERRLLSNTLSTQTTTSVGAPNSATSTVADGTIYLVPDDSNNDLSVLQAHLQRMFPLVRFVTRNDFFSNQSLLSANANTMPRLKIMYLVSLSTPRFVEAHNHGYLSHIKRQWGAHALVVVARWGSNPLAFEDMSASGEPDVEAQIVYDNTNIVGGQATSTNKLARFINAK